MSRCGKYESSCLFYWRSEERRRVYTRGQVVQGLIKVSSRLTVNPHISTQQLISKLLLIIKIFLEIKFLLTIKGFPNKYIQLYIQAAGNFELAFEQLIPGVFM